MKMDRCADISHSLTAISLVLLVLLLSPLGCKSDDIIERVEDVCPTGRAVLTANRTVGVDPSYDGGTVEYWFTAAREFVNTVKKENLPYDVIEDGIESGGVACAVGTMPEEQCLNETDSSFSAEKTFSNFLEWWTPILIVSGVGVAVGTAFLLAGCVFLICRCCGKCGGGYSLRQSHDCATCSSTLLLLLCTLGLMSGVVLTFHSNQQSYDSLDSLRVSVNSATNHAVEFAEDLINDGIALFCLVVDTVHLSLQELQGLSAALSDVLEKISSKVKEFLDLLGKNVDDIDAIGNTLARVIDLRSDLDTRQQDFDTALANVADLATALLDNCENSGADCRGLPHHTIFTTAANYSLLPDVTNVSVSVNRTLSEVDFQNEVNQGCSNFSECEAMIKQNITMHVNESKLELERLNETVIEQRDNITNSTREILRRDVSECSDLRSILNGEEEKQRYVDLNAGYIQHCIIDQGFEDIQQYDAFRYGFGVAVCCLSLIVVVLALVGLVLGVAGWRPKKHPSDRTTLSHCGGKFLLAAVAVAYVFGWMVMVLSAVGFFFGSNAQKVCQSLEGPEYEGFVNIVDNEELWGGSLLGTVVFDDPQKTLSLSQLLRNCKDDLALYKAMNLSFLFDIHNDIINFTEVTESLSEEIFAAAESVHLTSDSFFSSTALQALTDINRHIGNIHIDAFLTQLDDSKPTLGYSVNEVVYNLTEYRNATSNATLQDQVDQLISDIEEVSKMAKEIDTQADALHEDITALHTLVTTTSKLVELATDIISTTGEGLALILDQISTGTFTKIAQHIDNFIQDLATGLDTSIGRCRPLWGIYTELYIAVCYEVVDGLNGFWLSLGLCGLFFVPVIILSVVTSTCYMRQENTTSSYFLDDPYADYLMDDTLKRNSSVSIRDSCNVNASEDQV